MTCLVTPLVSIILPVYNGERYLAESIQSCLDQTYERWELIIVDDASIDRTAAISAEFAAKDSRVRCIRLTVNKRLPGALNTGFAEARGEYLTWTSDDNCYCIQAIEEMVAFLSKNREADLVYTDYDIISETGKFVQTQVATSPLDFIQQYMGMPSFLYRRSIYTHIGDYAEDLFLAEDYDFWLRILVSGFCMRPLHKSLYRYRRHPHSLTDTYKSRTFQAAEQALLRQIPQLTLLNATLPGRAYLHLASLARWRGDQRKSAGYTLCAARYAPGLVVRKAASFLIKQLSPV